jgi:tryptophan synthase alpha chain
VGRISERFALLRARGERALFPFVTAGDPDLETTEALLLAFAEVGADGFEIGVPFSDPIADGPTVQRSTQRALAAKTSLRRVLELVKRVRPKLDVPLLLMGYANPFLAMGERQLAAAAAEVGVDGVLCPDLPPEEGESFYAALEERGVDPVLFAAPTTKPERLAMLVARTRGFLYYVSLTGVTGARAGVAADLRAGVERARGMRDVPVLVGFGVSTPEHAREIGEYADGVVVASSIIDRMERAGSREEAVDVAARFVAELKAPLREPRRG